MRSGYTEKDSSSSLPTIYLSWLYFWLMVGGGVVLNLLLCGNNTAHWFLIPPRAYPLGGAPETRVLGLAVLMESERNTDPGDIWELTRPVALRTTYLADMEADQCSRSQPSLAGGTEEPPASVSRDCDFECLLQGIRVPCKKEMVYPLPVPPAPRVAMWTYAGEEAFEQEPLQLRYRCEYPRSEIGKDFQCPDGFQRNASEEREVCADQMMEAVCDVDRTVRVDGIMGVTDDISYLHAFGWAQHQVLMDYITNDNIEDDPWCPVSQLNCELYGELASNGRMCRLCLMIPFVVTMLAMGLGVSKWKDRALPVICIMYFLSALTVLWGVVSFQAWTTATLGGSMTPVDTWGRPHIHPMWNYDPGKALASGNFGEGAAEWVYYHINARVDFVNQDPHRPQHLELLWGANLAYLGGVACLGCAAIALELLLGKKGYPPLKWTVLFIINQISNGAVRFWNWLTGRMACCRQGGSLYKVGAKVKNLFESTGSVLEHPPWHAVYDQAFILNSLTWLPWGVYHLYDYVLMLPVHCIRAILDNLSGQDITSSGEKAYLQAKGIENTRLRSLLCSRRSYFAMMILLGSMISINDLHSLVSIATYTAFFRQAAGQEDVFPHYRCAYLKGNCSATTTDVYTMRQYLGDMAVKVVTGLHEGENLGYTAMALVGWFGQFLGLFCIGAALFFWTDFTVSRKIFALGCGFAVLTPVIASSFPIADLLDWDRAEQSMLKINNEVWEEFAFFVSQMPCDVTVPTTQDAAHRGFHTCDLARQNNWDLGGNAENCVLFQEYYQMQQDGLPVNSAELCNLLETYRSEGLKSRITVHEFAGRYMPFVMDNMHYGMGLRSAFLSFTRLFPSAVAPMPALMQCGLLVKDMFPWRTLPSAMAAMAFVFPALFWIQCQVYFHLIVQDSFFFALAAVMTFAPLIYYGFVKGQNLSQPMDDQQAASSTYQLTRKMIVYGFFSLFPLALALYMYRTLSVWGQRSRVTQYNLPASYSDMTHVLFTTLYIFAYVAQAGVDWFVNELVEIHIAEHLPAVVCASQNKEELDVLQMLLGTSIDTEAIVEGTYMCGSVEDQPTPDPNYEKSPWKAKTSGYSMATTSASNEMLDTLASHHYQDPGLAHILASSRRPWYELLNREAKGDDAVPNFTEVQTMND